jgi:aminopeptidase-like protein
MTYIIGPQVIYGLMKNNNRQTYLIQRIMWILTLCCHKNKHLQACNKSKVKQQSFKVSLEQHNKKGS